MANLTVLPVEPAYSETGGYPVRPLKSAVEVAAVISELSRGETSVGAVKLALRLGCQPQTQSFYQRVGTARIYGLIDGRSAYYLTDLGQTFLFNSNDSERLAAGLLVLYHPPVFQKIVGRFDGQHLPARETLERVLETEYGVPKSWVTRVARFFIDAARFCGVLDSTGLLRYSALNSLTRSVPKIYIAPPGLPRPGGGSLGPELSEAFEPAEHAQEEPAKETWEYGNQERKIRLEVPMDMTSAEWERLRRQVEAMRPEMRETSFTAIPNAASAAS